MSFLLVVLILGPFGGIQFQTSIHETEMECLRSAVTIKREYRALSPNAVIETDCSFVWET